MTAIPGNPWFLFLFTIVLLIAACYAAGRLHQFYRQNTDRDHAFRNGYDTATKSLFSLATRTHKALAAVTADDADTAPIRAQAPVHPATPSRARHRARDRRKADLADTSKINYGDDQKAS